MFRKCKKPFVIGEAFDTSVVIVMVTVSFSVTGANLSVVISGARGRPPRINFINFVSVDYVAGCTYRIGDNPRQFKIVIFVSIIIEPTVSSVKVTLDSKK